MVFPLASCGSYSPFTTLNNTQLTTTYHDYRLVTLGRIKIMTKKRYSTFGKAEWVLLKITFSTLAPFFGASHYADFGITLTLSAKILFSDKIGQNDN